MTAATDTLKRGLVAAMAAAWMAVGSAARAEVTEADKAFEQLFGNDYKAVIATSDSRDDIALAQRMIEAGRSATGQPAFVVVLCDYAYKLATKHPDGYAVAIESQQLLVSVAPEQQDAAADRVLTLRQRRFAMARGDDRTTLGQELIDALVQRGDSHVAKDQLDDALRVYRQATGVVTAIKSDSRDLVRARLESTLNRQRIFNQIEQAKSRLRNDPKDATAAEELLKLHVVDLDDPEAARKYSFLSSDPKMGNRLKQAAGPVEEVPEAEALELGEWYRGLADGATGDAARAAMLRRAKAYYDRFLAVHEAKDLDRVKASLALQKVETDLAAVEKTLSPAPTTASGKWIDLLEKIDPAQHGLLGEWSKDQGTLRNGRNEADNSMARLAMPQRPTGAYELQITFEVVAGGDNPSLFINVAAGEGIVTASLNGRATGFGRIDGNEHSNSSNPTHTTAMDLAPAQKHVVVIGVAPKGDQVALELKYDGKPVAQWSGPAASLDFENWARQRNRKAISLGVARAVIRFHEVKLRVISGKVEELADVKNPAPGDDTANTPAPNPFDNPQLQELQRRWADMSDADRQRAIQELQRLRPDDWRNIMRSLMRGERGGGR